MTVQPKFEGVAKLLAEAVRDGVVPGIAAGVLVDGECVLDITLGHAETTPEKRPLKPEHRFDLASLTKVVATTPLIMRKAAEGVIRLDDALSQFGEDLNLADLRLIHLLTHVSGLPSWIDLAPHPDRASRLSAIREASRIHAPGERVVYSDLNYVTLGYLVETLYGQSLGDAFRDGVAAPLGMTTASFGPIDPDLAVPTEIDPQSGRPFCGVVHDENARAADGCSGHAGLFGRVSDLLAFGQVFVTGGVAQDGHRWMGEAVMASWLRARTTAAQGEIRAVGFQHPHFLSSAGDFLSPEAVGHTGFTGTSLWIDPTYRVVLVLLTNRVHPSRANQQHIRLRPRFHNAVMAAIGA